VKCRPAEDAVTRASKSVDEDPVVLAELLLPIARYGRADVPSPIDRKRVVRREERGDHVKWRKQVDVSTPIGSVDAGANGGDVERRGDRQDPASERAKPVPGTNGQPEPVGVEELRAAVSNEQFSRLSS